MQLDPLLILVAVAAGLIFHTALAVTARKINPLLTITAAFFVFAPLSGASDIPGVEGIKYARLYCSILIVGVGVFLMRAGKPRPAGLVFLLWAIYYMSAAVYGPNVVGGLTLKGLYILVVMSGLVAAYSVRSIQDLQIGLRMVLLGSGVFALILFREMATNPHAVASVGRLVAFGMNPSRIGQECAPMLICGSAVAFYDRSKGWRLLAYGICSILALATIASGSRGGTFMAIIGVFTCAFPLIKRPFLLGFTALVVYVVGGFILSAVSEHATERLQDFSFETREGIWAEGWELFSQSPFVGLGWVVDEQARAGGSTRNMHSVYMQILVETGILGGLVFAAAIGFVLLRGLSLFFYVRQHHLDSRYMFFALGLMGAILAHCTAESSTIMGSNINALMLPFSIGLVDRLREILPQYMPEATGKRARAAAYDDDYAGDYGYGEQPGLATT